MAFQQICVKKITNEATYYSFGIAFNDNARKVYLGDFCFDNGDKFINEYNFFEHWLHDIRIEKIEESPLPMRHAHCIKGAGMPGSTKHDELNIKFKILKAIVKAKKSTTMGDIQRLIGVDHRYSRKYPWITLAA